MAGRVGAGERSPSLVSTSHVEGAGVAASELRAHSRSRVFDFELCRNLTSPASFFALAYIESFNGKFRDELLERAATA